MFFALAVILASAQAPQASITAPPPVAGPIENLKPGGFFWAPQIAPAGPVTMIVSLKAQRAFVYRNGVPIGVSTISSGKAGHETPTGIFTILQKEIDHKSNLYSGAPMPFMQRLTWDGVALHAGALPGYPASHGCVRLPMAFAKLLYGVTKLGLTVVITDEALVPEVAPADMLSDVPDDGHVAPASYRWAPEQATSGPISIVVSGRDRRLVVLRNGVEIGSAAILLDAPVARTEAFTLQSVDGAGQHWLRLPLPGQTMDEAGELTEAERSRGHLPDGFRAKLEAVLQPGATLLVTRESLASSGTGTRLSVLRAGR